MGIVIQFPVRRRREPRASFDVVRVLPAGSYGEHLVLADDHGWLFGNWSSAVAEAVELAAGFGLPISIDLGRT